MSKKKVALCFGVTTRQLGENVFEAKFAPQIWKDAGKHRVSYWDAFDGFRPENVKRIRMKCPTCGRKLLSSVNVCHDGCCIIHSLPPHKPKGWWKKGKRRVDHDRPR